MCVIDLVDILKFSMKNSLMNAFSWKKKKKKKETSFVSCSDSITIVQRSVA